MLFRFIFISAISIIFSGCLSSIFVQKDINQKTDFKLLTYSLSQPICSKIKPNKPLYVIDFVNESNLKNRSELGFLLSNETKVNILRDNCQKNISIKSLSLSKNLKIGKDGSSILSRDLKDLKLKDFQDNLQILAGSYMLTKNQLILFLKLIDLKTNNTISSTTKSTLITNEIKELEGINTDTTPTIYKPFHL
jgi:hypothetical protein